MRVVFSFFIILLFVGCGGAAPKNLSVSNPVWYEKRSFEATSSYEYIGYVSQDLEQR